MYLIEIVLRRKNCRSLLVFKMASSIEADLTQKLETSSLKAAQNEIPIGKDAADIIKAQANEAFKSISFQIIVLFSFKI